MPRDHLRWDDPSLLVASDPARRAKYRLLQSWYRETVLGVLPGTARFKDKDGNERTLILGNMLPVEEKERRRLNFLRPEVARYAEQRAAEVKTEGGTLEPNRLYRNMLSSMPLCFNLFGWLGAHPADAATSLSEVLGLDIACVTSITVEWAPPPKQGLGDRTAFDAFVEYTTPAGEQGFVGVETKYTEPFSREKYARDSYGLLTAAPESGFKPGAVDALTAPKTNQLWRNVLLAINLRRHRGCRLGHAAVLACADDPGVKAAANSFDAWHTNTGDVLRMGSLESLIAVLALCPESSAWAREFKQRYLDTAPVEKTRSHTRR